MEVIVISNIRLAVYTFAHFCVDFCCFYVLFFWSTKSGTSLEYATLAILIYNIIAFAFQPIIGYYYDVNRNLPLSLIGILLTLTGVLTKSVIFVALPVIAFGNACFHVGGGVATLILAKGKMSKPGVFVSSGALGVVLGTLAGSAASFPFIVVILSLLICILLLSKEKKEKATAQFNIVSGKVKAEVIILITFLVIVVRSFAGSIIPLPWRDSSLLYFFPALGAFTGKALGGFIADKWGARKTAYLSLLLSAFTIAWGYLYPWFYLIGIIMFNMTMPITLCILANIFREHYGLAFGITTLALLCGNLPIFFVKFSNAPLIFFVLVVVSAIFMCYILGKEVKFNEETQ